VRRLVGMLCTAIILLLSTPGGQASPLNGGWAERPTVPGGQVPSFTQTFKGGERACVMVVGDHQPVVALRLKVEDASGNLVAEDNYGGDYCAVIWYPPRDGKYRISIDVPHIGGPEDFNRLYISVK
jgi:hypothetical protein